MKPKIVILSYQLLIVILVIVVAWLLYARHATPGETSALVPRSAAILTNQQFIDGLYTRLNLSDPKAVFQYVFSGLEDEVTIYPTENFFYFRFTAEGKVIWGALSLFPESRDEGRMGFGYIERTEDPSVPYRFKPVGGGAEFTAQDSVFVRRIDNWTYDVAFENKTVRFHLYDIGMVPPRKAKLLPEEIFVGPVFDESGLKFFLIYNDEVPHLYFVLNEDDFVPETFDLYAPDIAIGKRTSLAFYLDRENSRKILIGAKGENVLHNNWYDGPFDHMPDNYIFTGQIPHYQKYIENAYPQIIGRVDRYGHYLDENGTRLAVGPYFVYWSLHNLSFVDYCKTINLTPSQFYSCITQQVYTVPEEKYEVYPEDLIPD